MSLLPDYLRVSPAELGRGTNVTMVVKSDMAAIGQAMADDMFEEILRAQREGRNATLIVPVGPVEGFPILAEKLRREKISMREVMLINMDEYLARDGGWVPLEHPLSFRAFMNRSFYGLLDAPLAPRPENRVFPDPKNPGAIQNLIDARGGVDACFGGIGINGHLAFNEPPEPGETINDGDFAHLPTRTLALSRETRTINSVTVGGEIAIIPQQAVTVGMKEILEARRLRLYCNRPWQSAVVRRALHGPVTAACPASFMRHHPDARLTVAEFVAAPPRIELR
jgi:glucosamine-6-phosphate deaminase